MRVVVQVGRGSVGNITTGGMQFPYGNGLGINSMPFLPSFLLRGGSMGSGDPYDPVEGLSRLQQHGSDTLSRLLEMNSNLEGLLGMRQNNNFDARDFLEMLSDQEPDASSHINLERLPTKKYVKRNAVEDERCDICSETYNAGDEQRTLTCFHDYHVTCIDMWLQKNNTCPVCRMEVHTEGD
ncbi:E3 ubiquitin-protein ligase RNF181-like isoform X2 [Dreissena polymorpha]|nr:E3 ubiquitin-protein ligase RNF181-like isoform X2 [Dreissena polymorpha]